MTTEKPEETPANQVYLRGRLAAELVEKELPSGDLLVVFRLTVPRPPDERVRVDSIECVTSRPRPRRTLAKAAAGMELEVEGSLRPPFLAGTDWDSQSVCGRRGGGADQVAEAGGVGCAR